VIAVISSHTSNIFVSFVRKTIVKTVQSKKHILTTYMGQNPQPQHYFVAAGENWDFVSALISNPLSGLP
jgi:hypothetical protein